MSLPVLTSSGSVVPVRREYQTPLTDPPANVREIRGLSMLPDPLPGTSYGETSQY